MHKDIEKITYYVNQAVQKYTCEDYSEDWIQRGFEFASIGEDGREFFHKISATSSKYDYQSCDKKFDELLKSHTGKRNIGSFIRLCTDQLQIPVYRPSSNTKHSGFTEARSTEEKKEPKKLKTFTASELLSLKMEKLPTLIEPVLPKVGLACMAGSSDVGKSTILRQLALQIMNRDESFLGWKIEARNNKVIYVSTEDDSTAISYLINHQNKARNFNSTFTNDLRYIFETEDLLDNLSALLKEDAACLVIIDCLTDLFGGKGSLNESTHVRSFLNPYKELADQHSCLILFLHHTGKRSEDFEPNKRHLLGSQGIEGKMRLVMELRADPDDADLRHLCIVKGNYLPKEYKSESFELRFTPDMWFIPTGNRRPFEELQKRVHERSHEQKGELIDKVKQLTTEGLSQRKIAEQLNISLGYVNKLLKTDQGVHVHENPIVSVNVNADEPCPF